MTFKKISMALVASALLATTLSARDQIKIVGSSTVYPFASAVAEELGKGGKFPTPVVESTGTGGGINKRVSFSFLGCSNCRTTCNYFNGCNGKRRI